MKAEKWKEDILNEVRTGEDIAAKDDMSSVKRTDGNPTLIVFLASGTKKPCDVSGKACVNRTFFIPKSKKSARALQW